MMIVCILQFLVFFLAISTSVSDLITTSANPFVFRFEGDKWRNLSVRYDTKDYGTHLPVTEQIHADLVIDCRFVPLSKTGALVQIAERWVIFAAGNWYLFPHTIWKRIIDGQTQEELMAAGCDVYKEARHGLAELNLQWNLAMDDFWLELPLIRANERLMIRGGGHIAEWIDDSVYSHSFQLKSFETTELIGQVNLPCNSLIHNYHTDKTLADLLFRTDEQSFLWPKVFLPVWSGSNEDYREYDDVEISCLEPFSPNISSRYQPLTFLASNYKRLQRYLLEAYKCEWNEGYPHTIQWIPIKEFHQKLQKQAKDMTYTFPFLSIVE